MPSDERVARALELLAPAVAPYRAAIAAAAEEVHSYLVTHQYAQADGKLERARAELGAFAWGRIDASRFASLFTDTDVLDPQTLRAVEEALTALRQLAARDDEELLVVDVRPGGNMRQVVARALARAGRAFGAARAVALARAGRYRHAEHAAWVRTFPFERWNRTERGLAPPLVVRVAGADLRADVLAEFLDGAQKFVVVVRGESVPAPLVRLITPRAFVAQTDDPAILARLVAWAGPGIVALLPEGTARFVHDPAGGGSVGERLVVLHLPAAAPRKPVGGISAAQQADELRQLEALAATATTGAAGSGSAPAAAPGPPPAPVDRLAAWLLRHADLSDLG